MNNFPPGWKIYRNDLVRGQDTGVSGDRRRKARARLNNEDTLAAERTILGRPTGDRQAQERLDRNAEIERAT